MSGSVKLALLLVLIVLAMIVIFAIFGIVWVDESSGMLVVRLNGIELFRRCLYPEWGCRAIW